MRSPVAERASTCSMHFKIAEARHDLFDAGKRNQRARQGEAHAAVAFGFDDGDGAGFGDQEIRAADRGGNAEKFLAQIGAGRSGQGLRIVGEILEAHAAREDFADLAAIDMQRGNHDVRGLIVAELQDQFGKIGFNSVRCRRLRARGSAGSRRRSWS